MATNQPSSVEDYIADFAPEIAMRLEVVREAIRSAVPGSTEGIRYRMPVVSLDGTYVVHYSGWKHHIGMYPIPVMDELLEVELRPHRSGKDTVKFLHKDPVPVELITRLIRSLVELRSTAISDRPPRQ